MSRIGRRAALLLPLAAAWPQRGSAKAPVADAPLVVAGDEWRFALEHAEPSAEAARIWKVASVTAQGIEGTENGRPLRLSPELNLRESPARRESGGHALRFPLRVGDLWTYDSETRFKDDGTALRSSVAVQVLGVEPVQVAAGRFDAFRLRAEGSYRAEGPAIAAPAEGVFTSDYWYAPAVSAVVRLEQHNAFRGPLAIELVEARLLGR